MTPVENRLRVLGIGWPEVLLPTAGVDMRTWAVVACDQYTSEPAYWTAVEQMVEHSPSTLHMTLPEIYLHQSEARIPAIHAAMRAYEQQGVLAPAVHGFVLVERTTATGRRLGLVTGVDLEQYDFTPGAQSLIRPTEGTILSRIPPRVRIRSGAPLETTHVMLLVDDPGRTLIEPLYAQRQALRPLYDTPLMQDGGHVRGWAVDAQDEQRMAAVADALEGLQARAEGLLFAVGDGNHSLATARQCWLDLRDGLSAAERETHPARFALVEIVNLHDDALVFEPIHRVVFGMDPMSAQTAWDAYTQRRGLAATQRMPKPGEQGGTFMTAYGGFSWVLTQPKDPLVVATVQDFLDEYVARTPGVEVDYIHGEVSLHALCRRPDAAGCLLPALDKAELFPAVRARGVLPRKTFSMGEANEKRYYMECRKIIRE